MRTIFRALAPAMLAVLLCGCANWTRLGGDHVLFGEQVQHAALAGQEVHRVFFDRVGDLYPTAEVRVDDRHFAELRPPNLRDYFAGPNPSCTSGSTAKACQIATLEGTARRAAWDELQMQWRADAAKRLAKATGGTRPLVVLIHGYRVEDAERDYARARAKIAAVMPPDPPPVFLQVHWDGMKSPTAFGVWGEAQLHGFLVGLKLRGVLAALHPATKVRVMTHSSGAFVLAATLGDPSGAYGSRTNDDADYKEAQAHWVTSRHFPTRRLTDVRAAMIVPATPPISFSGYSPRMEEQAKGMQTQATLIVGVNEKDFGVSKGPVSGSASMFGSSRLGENLQGFCELREGLARRSTAPQPILIDFQGSRNSPRQGLFWDSHDWKDYLERDVMPAMLRALAGDDTAGTPITCTQAKAAG